MKIHTIEVSRTTTSGDHSITLSARIGVEYEENTDSDVLDGAEDARVEAISSVAFGGLISFEMYDTRTASARSAAKRK